MVKQKLTVLNVLCVILFFIQPVFSSLKRCNFAIDGTLNTTIQSRNRQSGHSSTSSGTFVWDSRINGSLSLRLSDYMIFSSELNIGYGQINIRSSSSKSWSKPLINSDFINFNSMIRYDNNHNNYSFARLKYCSSFFDQSNNNLHFNPYTLSAASGVTHTFDTDKLTLSVSGSAAYTFTHIKNRAVQNESDTKKRLNNENTVASGRSITGSVCIDADLSYSISECLYLNSKFLLSQPFASNTFEKNRFWHPPDVSMLLTINAPVTSFLNFCYDASFEFNTTGKKTMQFNQSLSAGFYFNLKSPV